MPARQVRLGLLGLLGLITAAGVAAFLVGQIATPGTPGVTGSPSAARTPATVASGSAGVPGSSSPEPGGSASQRLGGEGFAWSYVLPEDPDLARQVLLGFEIWTAGQGDALRGVFMGALDLGSDPVVLPIVAERLRGELGMIPGSEPASSPEPVRLAAGDALRVRAQVGATTFVGYALVADGIAYRLVVAGYPDEVTEAVAMSLRFE
jgi:hypothetical protein